VVNVALLSVSQCVCSIIAANTLYFYYRGDYYC
jgi:hypothetical protein